MKVLIATVLVALLSTSLSAAQREHRHPRRILPPNAVPPSGNIFGNSRSGVVPPTVSRDSPTINVLPPPRGAGTGGVKD